MKVLVTGARGMLGQQVCREFTAAGHWVTGLSHAEFDLTHGLQVQDVMTSLKPQLVVNCAAYTDVDGAEQEAQLACRVNGLGVGHLASACKENNITLMHISTDYVFSGSQAKPWRINDERMPVNAYGRSKLLGEWFLENIQTRYYLCRTSWLFGWGRDNFVLSTATVARQSRELRVVDDRRGCPTFACDLAQALAKLAMTRAYGVYHLTNQGIVSRCGLAQAIVRELGLPTVVVPVTSDDLPTAARRPANSALDPYPLQQVLGELLPPWEDALRRCLEKAGW